MPIATEPVISDEPEADAAALAREVNSHILALETRLDDESFLARDPGRHLIGLLCECGCMGIVAATRVRYEENGGAWLKGHRSGLSA